MAQTFQRRTTQRVLNAAPNLKFVAFYHRSEDRLNACMLDYGDRSFVYVFSSCYQDEEYFLYAGKSKAQYARCLSHSRKYVFDHIYLFECDPEYLTESERAVIRELTPIFNRKDNPEADRIGRLLRLDYDAVHDREAIACYLRRYANYRKMGLFGFALPVALYTALEEEAERQECSCGDLVYRLLEREMFRCGELELDRVRDVETNLVNTEGYGKLHSRSQEQVKQYLRQRERMPGTVKLGRDWIIPCDLKFPDDRRGNRKNHSGNETEA